MKAVIFVFVLLVTINMSTAVTPPKVCACALIHAPVCAVKTYPNACSAKCEGARAVENKPCKEPRALFDDEDAVNDDK